MGAHGSKEKLHRSASERFVHTQVIERERFGSFGKRPKKEGKKFGNLFWFVGGRVRCSESLIRIKFRQQLLENNSSQKKTRLRSSRANFWVNVKGYDLISANKRQF